MWDLRNRGIIALISLLSGSAFLYNAWGPILVVTISFFLVVYACYVLIINDSLLSPHALFLTEYCKQAALNVHDYFNGIVQQACQYAQKYWQYMEERFRRQSLMERRRGSNYQLSSDNPSSTTINSSGFGLIAEPSPIPRDTYKSFNTNTDFEKELYRESDSPSFDRNCSGKRISTSFSTSTLTPNKDNLENEDTEFYSSKRMSAKKTSPMYAQKHTLTRGESTTYFSPEGSPWGTSISPKIRSKGGGVKSVQTVAGPLLASTRYNIDPKVYSDVTSPGLTTRLTKYATEANTKLTYQSRYCAGRFPKVNLRANPIPVINANSIKTKTPVPGRVASPNTDRYSSLGKQKILFGSHRTEDRSSSDVARVLKEISLKRHASREEVLSDLAKKQRTDGSIRDEFETSDETKQKRSREDASKSEEEVSPQNRTVRPTKRTKTPSCYDILNSLSSSKHMASGVKRKAIDFSRSGTPDFEKHFKSLEGTQTPVETLSESPNVKSDRSEEKITAEIAAKNTDPCEFLSKLQECTPIKGILKSSMKDSLIDKTDKDTGMNSSGTQNAKGQPSEDFTSTESVKLTDKLFMRAEPQRNEKLRMLIEEQGSIKAKFTTNDAEEIKKEDIVNMRQNSMRARLQSMFDAISGKAANRINPDVVIQAEEVSTEKAVACPVTCATLNSSTTTTNINTTPISTSAIVPGLSVNESTAKPVKHVAFALPDKQDTSGPSIPITRTTEADNSSASFVPVTAAAKFESTFAAPAAVASVASVAPVTSDSSNISFGKLSQLSNIAPSPNSNALTHTGGTTDKATVALTATPETKGESNSNCTTTVCQSTVSALPNSTLNSSFTFRKNSVTPASMVGNAAYGATNAVVTRTQFTGIASTACTSMTSSVKTVSSTVSSSGQGAFVTGTSAPLFTFGNKIATLQSSKFQASGVKLPGSAAQSSISMANTFGNLSNPSASITVENGTTKTISTSSTFGSSMTPSTSPYVSSGSGSSIRDNKPGFSFGIAPTSIASTATGAITDSVTTAATVMAVTAATTTNSGIPITTNGKTISPFGAPTASVGSVPQFGSVGASIFGNMSSTPIFGQTIFGVSSSDGAVSRGFIPTKTTTAPIFASNCHTPSSGLIATNATSVFQNSGPSASASASANASVSTAMVSSTSAATIFGSNVNTLIVSSPGMRGGATSNLFTSANVNANTNANANANTNPNSNASGTASGITTTTSGSFGASGSNIFGQTKSPPGGFRTNAGVFGSNGTSLLGSQTTATPSFGGTGGSSGTTVPSFGSSNANVPTFGTTNAASTTFGTPSGGGGGGAALTGQTSSLQAFGTTSSVFGTAGNAAAPSLFGATATGAFSSGTPNAFSGQSANVGFGGPKSATGFVDNKPSPFGAQSTGVSAFGAPGCSTSGFEPASTTGGNNNSGSVFTFGGNQKQQNATFAFGSGNTGNSTTTAASVSASASTSTSASASASASASTSAPFQFGATTSQAATGFNFSAPSTTPSINFASSGTPTFNAPTPGMFSIGSGSTAPRFRSIRTKKTR